MIDPRPDWQTVPIDEVQRANIVAGHHWFDRETLRYFRGKVARTAHAATVEVAGDGGHKFQVRVAVFMSSEQFVPFDGPADPRRWTVRLHLWDLDNPANYSATEVGGFQGCATATEGRQLASHIVKWWTVADLDAVLQREVRWWKKVREVQ